MDGLRAISTLSRSVDRRDLRRKRREKREKERRERERERKRKREC